MTISDICVKSEYQVEGKKKVKWYNIGILKKFADGNQVIRLYHQPNIDLYVFEQKQNSVSSDESDNQSNNLSANKESQNG